MNMERGDRLLAHVASGGNRRAANELLGEFFNGYPVEKLLSLLYSQNEEAVKAGAFIAAELGDRFAPLVNELPRLLDHHLRAVRFDALDAVLENATADHGDITARAVLLVEDADEAVRWKALRFLARATYEQLASSVPRIDDSSIAELTAWLLKSERADADRRQVLARLKHEDNLTRMFAAVSAARLSEIDVIPLQHAAASSDPQISSFARDELEDLSFGDLSSSNGHAHRLVNGRENTQPP